MNALGDEDVRGYGVSIGERNRESSSIEARFPITAETSEAREKIIPLPVDFVVAHSIY